MSDGPHTGTVLDGDCTAANNELLRETPKYHQVITRLSKLENPWRTLFTRSSWEDGPASNTALIFRTADIDDDPSRWVRSDNCEGRSCDWSYEPVKIGQELRQACLVRTGFETDMVCLEELRDKVARQRIASGHLNSLARNVRIADRDWTKHAFKEVSQHIVAKPGYPSDLGGYAKGQYPASMVTPRMLRDIYSILRGNDAGDSPQGMIGNAPLLPMIIGDELYEDLKYIDPEFKSIILEVDAKSLLNPVGGESTRIGNFLPGTIQYPNRYSIDVVTGELVQSQPRITISEGKKGEYSIDNPDYINPLTSPFEEIYFPNKKSLEIKVPKGIAGIGPMSFRAQDYTGAPEWVNVRDNDCNKDGTKGQFRAKLEQAALPLYSDRGCVLLVERLHRDSFIKGCFLSNYSAPTLPDSVSVDSPNGCVQGANDTSLYISLVSAITWTDVNVKFGDHSIKKATNAGAAAVAGQPHRYLFTFDEDVTCGCCGGPVEILEYLSDAVPADADEVDACACITGDDPVALVCANIAPGVGFVSALQVDVAGLGVIAGDDVSVDFGENVGVRTGEVVTYVDPTLVVAFTGIAVTCESGAGVISVVAL
jgi:hypothetical protein